VTGARISDALRAGDTASRVGGDEFVLVCATNEATIEAARLATRLLTAIGQPIDIGGTTVSVGASIGISLYPADGVTGDELIRKADSAMYSAKDSGRNLFHIYHEETHSSIVAALDLEAELVSAFARDEIVVHYQPVVTLHTNQLSGAEALVRWQHPRRGLLHPADFLVFAEQHRLSGAIDTIVLNAVCEQIAQLGSNIDAEFRISMNVFARALVEPGWVETVATALAAHGADPNRLQIEVAETIVMSEPTSVIGVFTQLRAMGIALTIDNLGTGLSSLGTVKNFPLATLKIDRSFVHAIATDSRDQAVAKTIITLAHNLGLRVVAAGVETPAQLELLRAYGTDAFQGYLASPPIAASDFHRLLAVREPFGPPPPPAT
jgi:predicted signal transduction protein with EAL and GGDEF domain